MSSEITIRDVWPKLCELGIIELRINDFVAWSDHVMDCMFGRDDYDELNTDYLKRAEAELLSDSYENFRVTDIKIKVVMDHHCVADIQGYFEEDSEDYIESSKFSYIPDINTDYNTSYLIKSKE